MFGVLDRGEFWQTIGQRLDVNLEVVVLSTAPNPIAATSTEASSTCQPFSGVPDHNPKRPATPPKGQEPLREAQKMLLRPRPSRRVAVSRTEPAKPAACLMRQRPQ